MAELVARLPWQAWAERHNPEFVLTRSDADRVARAITQALRSNDLDLDTAQEVAVAALGQATGKNKSGSPVPYVAGAFADRRLSGWLGAVCPAELSENPLPLPTPQRGGDNAAAANTGATTATPDSTEGPEIPEWCGECADGDARAAVAWTMRRVESERDYFSPCPVCHPDHAAA